MLSETVDLSVLPTNILTLFGMNGLERGLRRFSILILEDEEESTCEPASSEEGEDDQCLSTMSPWLQQTEVHLHAPCLCQTLVFTAFIMP